MDKMVASEIAEGLRNCLECNCRNCELYGKSNCSDKLREAAMEKLEEQEKEIQLLRDLVKDNISTNSSRKSSITRNFILSAAIDCVCRDRNDTYGSPEDNFKIIADMWNAYMFNKTELDAKDIAAMLALLKIARISTGSGGHLDNWIDLAGYAACGGEIEAKPDGVSNN